MPLFKVEIIQHLKAVRSITVEVDADTLEDAIRKQDEELPSPDSDDPRWETDWDLQSDEVYAPE